MSDQRDFDFPISTLTRDAKLLLGALRDPVVGPTVAARLKKKDPAALPFDQALEKQIGFVEKGGTDQSGALGGIGTLTTEQAAAYTEMERLLSGARRSAGLAFPGNTVVLHSEFQVGTGNDPQDLGSELERAGKVAAACVKYADDLGEHGWMESDTTDLDAAIETLTGGDDDKQTASSKKKGLTKARNLAANLLYKMCLSLQNAARLAYPNTRADDANVVEARSRYLLDVFPPERRSQRRGQTDPAACSSYCTG